MSIFDEFDGRFEDTPESLLDVALEFVSQAQDLSEESRVELAGLVNYLRENPNKALAVAIETKVNYLRLKQLHSRTLGAIEASALGWLDKWRLKQGQEVAAEPSPQTPLPRERGNEEGAKLLPKPVRVKTGRARTMKRRQRG